MSHVLATKASWILSLLHKKVEYSIIRVDDARY